MIRERAGDRSVLNRVEVNAHKHEAAADPRSSLLGALRSFDKTALKKVERQDSVESVFFGEDGDGRRSNDSSSEEEGCPSSPIRGRKFDPRTALLASLGGVRRGTLTLRKVERTPRPSAIASPKNEIMGMLAMAMDARRAALEDDSDNDSDTDGEWD